MNFIFALIVFVMSILLVVRLFWRTRHNEKQFTQYIAYMYMALTTAAGIILSLYLQNGGTEGELLWWILHGIFVFSLIATLVELTRPIFPAAEDPYLVENVRPPPVNQTTSTDSSYERLEQSRQHVYHIMQEFQKNDDLYAAHEDSIAATMHRQENRENTEATLKLMQRSAAPALMEILDDPNWSSTGKALAYRVLDDLIPLELHVHYLINSDNPIERKHAVHRLTELGVPEAVDILEQTLNDHDPEISHMAVESLIHLGYYERVAAWKQLNRQHRR